ncbi:MAG: hypothetical protein KTR28_05385 [Micavibrio sp.]|nr:hypothetical protein [Micavibrio sp.]
MSVQAQGILDIFKKEMPKVDDMPEDEFGKKSLVQEEYPVGARDLAFEINIPKDWGRSDNVSLGSFILNKNVLSTIAKFNGPIVDGLQQYLQVQGIGITKQTTAKGWFYKYLLDNNYSVNGFIEHNDRDAEALYVFVNQGIGYVARARAIINGQSIIFMQHVMPMTDWQEHKVMQKEVVNSFNLKFPNDTNIVDLEIFDFLEVASFSYPATWSVNPKKIDSIERMNAEINNIEYTSYEERKRENLVGTIDAYVISVFTLEDLDTEIASLRNSLTKKGLFVQEEIEGQNGFVFDEEDALSEMHVYEMVDKEGNIQSYEYWIHIMAEGDYFKIVTLLTPSRERAYFKWSENTEVLKLVSKSFHLNLKDNI